jgi:hypothetical protein
VATATRLPPADVAERLFGVDVWDTPREILASVFSPNSRTAVKACHASSKTHTAAIAIALALYEGADVLTTAPTWEQVKTVLWGTITDLLAYDTGALSLSERPYLVTRQWVLDRYYEWGTDHPLWQSRVRGQFPLQSDDSLLSLAWLEAAANRPAVYAPGLSVQAGVDVAGPGDDETVLCVRQGDAILHLQGWSQSASGPRPACSPG